MRSMHTDYLSESIKFVELDVNDIESVKHFIIPGDFVLCATGSINATNPFNDISRDITDYYLPYINLLNECASKNIGKFIFLSSAGTVYGNASNFAKEDDRLNPLNIYGVQKAFFEQLIQIKHNESKQLPHVILRVSNPYGGIQNPLKNQGIIPVLINKALNGEKFEFWGDINATRDFIYIDDFLKATYLASKCAINEVINVASGTCSTIGEVIDVVQHRVDCKIDIVYKTSANTVVKNNLIDNSKLKSITGFSPSITLEDGIQQIVGKMLYAKE
ncbi:hypothetical protein PSTEL_24510 [Paenibacillus stellifer]|uniref:NAD-dependent epimerase/dehydratase domain-containing protein n=2 Tax=Paenibacillus stellifer TaxID=169760 RepID=A0A089M2T5_9BACL|nr:hypothetical protein PSTEL_24510 [Paenibacillus stellifer]